VRRDILDYYSEVERFDRRIGELILALEKAGRLDNTLIVVASDNGMPSPRANANLYDLGTHMPLADPHQLKNVADRPEHSAARSQLRADLDRWMRDTAAPRAIHDDDHWDRYPYYGRPGREM
jgi:hypothetical protein